MAGIVCEKHRAGLHVIGQGVVDWLRGEIVNDEVLVAVEGSGVEEDLRMVAVQVFGNDAAVAFGGSQGNFQLNVFKPVMVHNVLESIQLIADACTAFNDHCAVGIEPNVPGIEKHLHESLMTVTALSPHLGYDTSAAIAKHAHHHGLKLEEAVVALGHLTVEEFRRLVLLERMTRPEPLPEEVFVPEEFTPEARLIGKTADEFLRKLYREGYLNADEFQDRTIALKRLQDGDMRPHM